MLLLRPNRSVYLRLLDEAARDAQRKAARWYAEQGFLNAVFASWRRLPAGYNVQGATLGRPVREASDFFVHEKVALLGPRLRARLRAVGVDEPPPARAARRK